MGAHLHVDVAEANRALGRQFLAEQDRRRGAASRALCAAGYRATIGGNPPMDWDGHEGLAQAFYAGLSDLRHDVEDVFATDDRVLMRAMLHGTHTGNLFGMAATGRSVVVAAQIVLHVADGRVTELFGLFDEAGMLRQLGVLPSG